MRMLNSQLIPDRKLVQDLTYRAQCVFLGKLIGFIMKFCLTPAEK